MNNLAQKQERLPFLKTMREVVNLRKEERVDRATVRKILRFGVDNPFGRGAILFVGALLIVVPLIFLNVVYTYLSAFVTVAVIFTSGLLLQSDRGAKAVSRAIDSGRAGVRMLAYPVTYLKFVDQYESSSAITPEHFYLLRRFQKQVGEKLFDEVRNLCAKFPDSERKKLLHRIIALAYEMSKQGKDVRDILEIQVPVAIEVSEGVRDFESNLAVVEQILTGPYDVQLIRDKQRFKAFFVKVGVELHPISPDDTAELIGLIERRLTQQGFNIGHFYDEVFKEMEKETLSGALEIILEIVKCGFFPTKRLIDSAKRAGDRKALYQEWQVQLRNIREGNFDLTNPLHVDIEYSTFRRIVDNSRIISEVHKDISYPEYLRIVRAHQGGKKLSLKERAELQYAAYEAMQLKAFIDEVKEKARSFGRDVLVIPNLSYGRFAAVFIEGNLRLEDVKIAFAKIGSSQTHENPYYIDPRFIRSQTIHNLVSDKPVVIVVDGSIHLDRYPDAYQGYLNLTIALNDVFSGGDESRYAALVGRSRRFIRALKGQSDFRSIRKIIQNAYEKGAKKDRVCYSFHFWNPRGVELKIRSSWKTRRGTLGKPTPVKAEELNGPAFIFVNSVLTDSDLPKEVKKRAGGFEHNPAYFDDVPDISITKLFFQFDGTGVHLVDSMHELEMKAMEGIAPRRESRAVAQRTRVNYRV